MCVIRGYRTICQHESRNIFTEFRLNMEYNLWFHKIRYNITLWFLIQLFLAFLCSFGLQLIDMFK